MQIGACRSLLLIAPATSFSRPISLSQTIFVNRADIENKTATIEEIHDESDSEQQVSSSSRVQSRGEIKARKALSKLGLVKVKGVNRVTIRRSGQPILAIAQPDVYKSLNSDTYVVFGEGQPEDINSLQSQLQAAQEVLKDGAEAPEAAAASAGAADEEDDEEVDEEGVNKEDIELVIAQANVSRAKAVKALKANDNDIVNAIMMASTRFKNVIACQLAKLTGGDASVIARAIDRPKVKGHGTFAVSLPRLFPSQTIPRKPKAPLQSQTEEAVQRTTVGRKHGGHESENLSVQEAKAALLSRIPHEFDTTGLIRSVTPAGQFLNFTVDERQYTREVIQGVVKAEEAKQKSLSTAGSLASISVTKQQQYVASLGYGTDPTVGQGQVIAIDYSSPNIAKPFHGGHLRGTILGNFATRLLRGFGYQVVGINYLGDWGKQYGLMAVGFDRYGDRTKLRQDPIKHLYDVYVKINRDITENPHLDKLANQYFKQMEDNDPNVLSLWQEFRSLSIDVYKIMYKRLGIEFDVYSGESESAKYVPQAYDLLRKKGLLEEQEDGAWVVDLTEHGLGICTLRRADGTTLYLTRDVAACLERVERFKFDRHLYMIGDDQNLHMKRLFKIMELAYADEINDRYGDSSPLSLLPHWSQSLQHISFGKVQGMSTRKGNVVFLEDILDTAQSTMLEKMKDNKSKFEAVKESLQQQQQQEGSELYSKEDEDTGVRLVADQLGISAVVIQDFQARSSKGYEFSWRRMTESTGNTGIYLHIESRSGTRLNPVANTDLLTEPEAFELANMISMYPDITLQTLQSLEPSMIVNYLFGLSHAISSANQVLQVKAATELGQQDLAEARMLLLWAARVTLGNGLRILGLEPLERM
ncbi:Arginyl-tRNA synthetase [Mortierella claussenii]|nr:Arginyl-tRNA synthetase [Mortierella claussenii]